jgi:TolB-like protein/DNA-binding winged helix-turn-helix (wHTH) protein/Tfp pilus assembly protein PilF
MPAQNLRGEVRIGKWIVHPALDCIVRGTETQKLEPRMMRLLLCLADSAGAVVSVDRLLTEVWPDVVVGSASVYQAVSQLRKILGDVDPNPTYIATIPRKGYRLIASVQRATAAGHTPQAPVVPSSKVPPRRVWTIAGVFVALTLAAVYFLGNKAWLSNHAAATHEKPAAAVTVSDESIAVLPFMDMSEMKDQEYFADGMAEELINHLSRSPGLKVIARTSSFQFKGRNEDARAIAGRLGVAHLLEGSVRKAGQELRVTTQLIRASDGVQLWSETFDRNLADIFKVQDEISERVTKSLKATFAVTGYPIGQESDVEAYNLVLEGNYYKARRTKGEVEKAIQLYEKAIDIRPNYALPWARLASAYLILEEAKGTPSEEGSAKILAALGRAIDLDPNLVWAYYTRAGFEIAIKWDWAAAQADHERMRALDPGSYLLPIALAELAMVSGHVDDAIQQYELAVELDPLNPNVLRALGDAFCASDRLQECLQLSLRLQQLHPELHGVNALVGEAHLLLGQFPEAFDAMQKEPEQDVRLAGLASIYTAMGKRAESDAALKTLEESYASDAAYEIAQIHAFRGEADAGFAWLQRSFRMHNSKILFIKTDPLLRNLHRDRRFQTLLTNLHLPE